MPYQTKPNRVKRLGNQPAVYPVSPTPYGTGSRAATTVLTYSSANSSLLPERCFAQRRFGRPRRNPTAIRHTPVPRHKTTIGRP